MKITLIWAQGHGRAIGRNNAMPWHLPEDFAHFRSITKGKPVLMGRKTWDSLPRKPLLGRTNVVVSRQSDAIEGASVFRSIEEAKKFCLQQGYEELVVIGGAQIYEAFLGEANAVWVTQVDLSVSGADTFAPELPALQWKAVLEHDLCARPAATATLYIRRAV